MNQEQRFREWMADYPGQRYGRSTIDDYVSALKNAPKSLNVTLSPSLLEMGTIWELQRAMRILSSADGYDALNQSGHNRLSAAFSAYQRFVNSLVDYTWIPFYREFGEALLRYRNDRRALIDLIVRVFADMKMKLPKLEIGGTPDDIDPFTVFALFNKGIMDANRIQILKGLAGALDIKTPSPNSFPGIPVVLPLSATFYHFQGNRGEDDIENLWELFACAQSYSSEPTEENKLRFISAFDTVRTQTGIKWNITMGLFWAFPYTFFSLDSRNRWFISIPSKITDCFRSRIPAMGNTVPDGTAYLDICDICKKIMDENDLPFSDYPSLSYTAWQISEEENDFQKNGLGDKTPGGTQDNSTAPGSGKKAKPAGSGTGGDAIGDGNIRPVQYWIFSPGDGASKWDEFRDDDIMAIGWHDIGDLSQYGTRADMVTAMTKAYGSESSHKIASLATWQFANEIMPGDIVFAKQGRHTIVGRGIVSGGYRFDAGRKDKYANTRAVNWTHSGQWPHPGSASIKVLTNITPYTDYVEKLNALFLDEEDEDADDMDTAAPVWPPYSPDDFLNEVFMPRSNYESLAAILKAKKNIILQGAPGVGKTFAAKRLAYSVMGEKNQDRVQMIQFHQSYSYEDFIEGYRPSDEGFAIRKGSFYKFCKKAADDLENDYFFIIDEINRGNLSRIFGELFMLIETDKRGVELQLLYSDERFSVPPNVHIIGMMNTADRGLALLDYALRRRFAFVEMKPGFDTDGFRAYRDALGSAAFDALINRVKALNTQIAEDSSLGEGFCIGHSYFCGLAPDTVDSRSLSAIVEYELLPLLREYWFDEPDRVSEWTDKLRGAVQ